MKHTRSLLSAATLTAITLAALCLATPSFAQNCSAPTTGFPPINDLSAAMYRGYQGGLYPNGLNTPQGAHLAEGLLRAASIVPLDTNGNRDDIKGRIVFISIGMSNTTDEAQAFKSLLDTFKSKNAKLLFLDCAQGGQAVNQIDYPTAPYWAYTITQLKNAGVTPKQVQAIWFKEAQMTPKDTIFPHHADTLVGYFTTIMQLLHVKFPNALNCYLSSRIYAGYATSTLNPEPYAYESGWAVKWLIERQIMGDTTLAYGTWVGGKLNGAKVPWLAWGPYLWADGTNPRSDGLTWLCPDDFQSDGTHPSELGRRKIGKLLLDFYAHDPTTAPWTSLLTTPVLYSPFDSAEDVGAFTIPEDRWLSDPAATYYVVQISKDRMFPPNQTIIVDSVQNRSSNWGGQMMTSSFFPELDSASRYYWRVQAFNSMSRSPWSKTWTFNTWKPSPPLPYTYYPSDSSTNVPLPISFYWVDGGLWAEPPFGPHGTFTVATDPQLTNVVYHDSGSRNQVSSLLANHTYWWAAYALANDTLSRWSDTAMFTTGQQSGVRIDSNAAMDGTPLLLQYLEGTPTLQYNLLSGGVLRLAAVDILGRQQPLIETPLASTRGTLSIPRCNDDYPLLFYVVSVGEERWVLRAVSKP